MEDACDHMQVGNVVKLSLSLSLSSLSLTHTTQQERE